MQELCRKFLALWAVLAYLSGDKETLALQVPNELQRTEQRYDTVREDSYYDMLIHEEDSGTEPSLTSFDEEGPMGERSGAISHPDDMLFVALSVLPRDWEHAVKVELVERYEDPWPTQNYSESEEETVTNESSEDNCTHPRQPMPLYNDSCDFVHAECEGKSELIDYLAFVLCNLPRAQPVGYIVMATWLIYLLSLLATTVDHYFVPPLTFLSEKLRLSPSVAGVTLMALGNGAPDIFVVFSGISQNDLALVLGTLSGAATFITTVVLGTVMLVSKVWPYRIDAIDFMRDIIAFMVVVGTVIGVAFDGAVYLVEACIFPLIYFFYIAVVVGLGYFRAWLSRRARAEEELCNSAHIESCSIRMVMSDDGKTARAKRSLKQSLIEKLNSLSNIAELAESPSEQRPLTGDWRKKDVEEESKRKDAGSDLETIPYLSGLSWPKGSHWVIKIIWVIQWPFSLLRWLTIPSFYHNGYWSVWHYLLTSFSPLPISILMLIAAKGWSGFLLSVGPLPLPVLLLLIAIIPSSLLFLLLRPKRPPHWWMQIVLVPCAFFMSIIWLNIMANEIVSIMRAFGLLLSIDTAILGLTILALGNCVADWVADTVVTRAGKPEMAFASCFGSPLLSHVLGLSIAMIVKIGFFNNGQPYRFHIQSSAYSQVKLSWIFLGVSLLASAIVFPIFKFSPPKLYGVVLIGVYLVFVIVAILGETGVLPFNL